MLHTIYVKVMTVVIFAVIFLGIPYLLYRMIVKNFISKPADIVRSDLITEIWKGLFFAFLCLIPFVASYFMLKHPTRGYADFIPIFGLLCGGYGIAIQLARSIIASIGLWILWLRNR